MHLANHTSSITVQFTSHSMSTWLLNIMSYLYLVVFNVIFVYILLFAYWMYITTCLYVECIESQQATTVTFTLACTIDSDYSSIKKPANYNRVMIFRRLIIFDNLPMSLLLTFCFSPASVSIVTTSAAPCWCGCWWSCMSRHTAGFACGLNSLLLRSANITCKEMSQHSKCKLKQFYFC